MIPVLYSAVLAMVPPLHEGRGEEEPYDIILHLGVAGPGGVKLEQRGRRWGYTKPDADGLLSDQETRGKRREGDEGPRGVPGKEWDGLGEGEEEELRTLVRCDTVTKYVAEQGVRIRESDEAGEPGVWSTGGEGADGAASPMQDYISASSFTFALSLQQGGRVGRLVYRRCRFCSFTSRRVFLFAFTPSSALTASRAGSTSLIHWKR